MKEDYKSNYFGVLEKLYPEEVVEEYKNRLLSVDEMKRLYHEKWERSRSPRDIDLQKDTEKGLYYTKHSFRYTEELLSNHIIAELLFAHKDQVDWRLVTNCFDYKIIKKINHILSAPLVWIPASDIENEYVVEGVDNVAAEVYPPEHFHFNDGRYGFYGEMREKALIWFADTLPTKEFLFDADRYDGLPDNLLLWDRLLVIGYHDLHSTMEIIIEKRGHAKAIEIIELLREQWESIEELGLLRDWGLSDYEISRYSRELTKGIEPYMRAWRIKAKTLSPKPEEQKPEPPAQQSPTEIHFHINGSVGQVVGNVKTMINTKEDNTNEG